MTERLGHHPQNIGVGHAFIPSLELQSKNRSYHRPSTASWAGEFFDRIAFFAVYPTTICNTTWMNVCPILASATDSSKQKPKKNISYSTKTQILKKTFRIYIITIISKPSIKSSVNGFGQISYETGGEKSFSNVSFKLEQTQKIFTLQQVKTMLQSQFTNVQFFFFFFQSMYCLFY